MASTLGAVKKEVRRWSRDTLAGRYAISERELNRIIEAEMHRAGTRIRLGPVWLTSQITVGPATNPPDYALPAAGVQYSQITMLRRQSDMRILEKVSQAWIQYRRRGTVILSGSRVSSYALVESTAQTVTVMFDVRPTDSDSIDVFCTVIPASLADSDSAAIPFDRDLIEGFQQGCAVRVIDMMSPQAKQERGFAPVVARGRMIPSPHVQALDTAYQESLRRAEMRIARMKLSGNTDVLLMREWLPSGVTYVR